MEILNKYTALATEVLNRTIYGSSIYFHIMKKYYPREVVIQYSPKTNIAKNVRNPFNDNKLSLIIAIKRNGACEVLKNITQHHDTEGAIPPGDALNFAELHYKHSGNELLHTLIREMELNIDLDSKLYKESVAEHIAEIHKAVACVETPLATIEAQSNPLFSFYRAPIKNTTPHKNISLLDAYNYIVGNYAKKQTEMLRSITDKKQARTYKAANFNYATFSGTFSARNDKALIEHSNLLCVDFDHLENIEELSTKLLEDNSFETELLFRSPSGDGLKWVISIDMQGLAHDVFFGYVARYIKKAYAIEVDKTGRDISRACFLPYDPQAYINPIRLTAEPQRATAQLKQ